MFFVRAPCIWHVQGVKTFYRHQVTATRPMKWGANALVTVTDLQTNTERNMVTRHAVLNIASEVMSDCCGVTFFADPPFHSSHSLVHSNNETFHR